MNQETSKIETQMKRWLLEYVILALLLEGDKYSSDILETLKKYNFIVVEGTLYPLLSRLKNEGHLSYYWKESLSWPPRKYFKITDSGKWFFLELDRVWKSLSQTINSIILSQSL